MHSTSISDDALWLDYARIPSSNQTTAAKLFDNTTEDHMKYIPGGTFFMGDSFNDGPSNETPVHLVYLDPFYMSAYEVTLGEWEYVASWAITNNYDVYPTNAQGKASNHPIDLMTWFDAVKWCNAKSEMEGYQPAYTITGSVYRIGQQSPECNWSANGYRLPTETEWEFAARGGLINMRFPWYDSNLIQHERANYHSLQNAGMPYDMSPTTGYHPAYTNDSPPYTSPVGSFEPNQYGLYDMSGNVYERCWDWYDDRHYNYALYVNPRGPLNGYWRSVRGGSWNDDSEGCRVAARYVGYPEYPGNAVGFRYAQTASQQ